MSNEIEATEPLTFTAVDLPVVFVVAVEPDGAGTYTVRSLLDGEELATGLTPDRRVSGTAAHGLAYRVGDTVHLLEAQEVTRG